MCISPPAWQSHPFSRKPLISPSINLKALIPDHVPFLPKKTGGPAMGPISWGGSNNTHFFLVIFRDFRENMCIVWVGNVMTPEKDIQRFEMSKVMAICYFSFRYKRIQIKDIYVVYLKQAIHDLLMLLLLLLFLVKKQRSPKVVDFGG